MPRSASSLLRDLLTREGAYRRRWRAEVRRTSRRDPHQSAVAMVLAQHLWDIGEVPEADADLPRRLKDVVARAVSGAGISHQTLGWFVGAFEMTEDDERALWRQHEADLRATLPLGSGRTTISAARGVAAPTGAIPGVRGGGTPGAHPGTSADYRTQSLIEVFEVGEDRSRRRHSLVHVLRAQQRLDSLSYRFDRSAVSVEVARDGVPAWLEPETAPGDIHTLEVAFPVPLEPGQTAVVKTAATYAPGGPVVTEFRRALRATAGGVSLEVHFDQEAVPARVRWFECGRSGPGELHTEDTPIGAGEVVHRFLTPDRACVVGFEWDW